MTVWAVVFSNYDPEQVNSLWTTQERAQKRADELGGMWEVISWEVQE